jgi:hypothetical protein
VAPLGVIAEPSVFGKEVVPPPLGDRPLTHSNSDFRLSQLTPREGGCAF